MNIFIMAASLRRSSFNKQLTSLCKRLCEEQNHEVDLADMHEFEVPLFNQDEEESDGVPAGALRLIERMDANDAVVFSIPEYNFSVPGVFKNLIDWVSRYKPMPWNDKKILLCSASPSLVGGNRGLWAVRVSLESCGSLVYPKMFSLAQAHNAFDDNGNLSNGELQQQLADLLKDYSAMVEKFIKVS